MKQIQYPFTAIVGQERLKNALIFNLICPGIGGVLACGEKGTAKSTLVRALGAVSGVKLTEVPLNVTEDRLVGALDMESAVLQGKKKLEKGLLAQADGGFLYVDEVNLLADHLTADILDAAASGTQTVEREGISEVLKTRFVLVGSMNPEEGSLRPQFLDRFGLFVEVRGEAEPRRRKEIIRRRLAFESDPEGFCGRYRAEEEKLCRRIQEARKRAEKIRATENVMRLAAQMAKDSRCQGHRADLLLVRTALAIAAWNGRSAVNREDLTEAASYVLPHRIRGGRPEPPREDSAAGEQEGRQEEAAAGETEGQQEEATAGEAEGQQEDVAAGEREERQEEAAAGEMEGQQKDAAAGEPEDTGGQDREQAEAAGSGHGEDTGGGQEENQGEELALPEELFAVERWLQYGKGAKASRGSGRRSLAATDSRMGRYVRDCMPSGRGDLDIAFASTVRAAAPYQRMRAAADRKLAVNIRPEDVRCKVRERRTGNLLLFVVDASGSMGVNRRMAAVKSAILSLLNDAYQKRDSVGLIVFRKDTAQILLPVTRSVELAEKLLTELPTGGRTPLAAGLRLARETVRVQKIKDSQVLPVIVLVSDGRATSGQKNRQAFQEAQREAGAIRNDGIKSIVIDTEQGFLRLGLAGRLAAIMEADLFRMEELRSGELIQAVKWAASER